MKSKDFKKNLLKRSRPYRSGYYIPNSIIGVTKLKKVTLRNPNKTIWDVIKEFINNFKIGNEFTRSKLINHIYITHMDQSTVDNYLNQLKNVGVIKNSNTGRLGRYEKLKNIPENLTTTKLALMANKSQWQSWFIQLEDI